MWPNTHTSVWKIEDSQKQKNQKDSVDFWCLKNDFESTNIVNFEEVVHNFGRSDDDMISWKKDYFQYMKKQWFDAQLD